MWLSSKNITTTRPSRSLEDKALGPYPIVEKVGKSYRVDLPKSMKRIHPVFPIELLRKDPSDPLPGQKPDPPRPVMIEDEPE